MIPLTRLSRRPRPILRSVLLLVAILGTQVVLEKAWGRPPTQATRYIVSAANPHATEAGLEILRAGGSAVDAAIAVQAVLSLVEPQSSGIGGGGFMLFHDAANGRLHAYDGRETAPAAATPALFLDRDGSPMGFREAVVGGRSVGVPGVLRMLERAHETHGRLPWARPFAPAIRLAREGFAVSPRLHFLLDRDSALKRMKPASALYYDSDGDPLPVGARLRNPAYAETLEEIAEKGADAFYEGPIAEDIVAAVQGSDNPGRLTLADLAAYEAKERAPLCAPYRAYRVCGMPPPTSGGVGVLQILGILEGFDLPSLQPLSADAVHLIAEASRLAYADRALYLADADIVPVPVSGLLDSAYLARRAGLIDPAASRWPGAAPAPAGRPQTTGHAMIDRLVPGRSFLQHGTSHWSIVDGEGNALAMTSSVETAFGSHLMVRGFLLNNQLTDFSFIPERDGARVANRVEGGKRPLSSMSPTIVFADERPYLLMGSPGGRTIISFVAEALIGVLDWGLDVQQAIELPHVVNMNGATLLERDTPLAALEDALEDRGHVVRFGGLNSGLHGIRILRDEDGRVTGLEGGADPRREGVAKGD